MHKVSQEIANALDGIKVFVTIAGVERHYEFYKDGKTNRVGGSSLKLFDAGHTPKDITRMLADGYEVERERTPAEKLQGIYDEHVTMSKQACTDVGSTYHRGIARGVIKSSLVLGIEIEMTGDF